MSKVFQLQLLARSFAGLDIRIRDIHLVAAITGAALFIVFSYFIALIHSPRHCVFASPGTAKVVTNGSQSTQHFII